jgi:hypothetical protein
MGSGPAARERRAAAPAAPAAPPAAPGGGGKAGFGDRTSAMGHATRPDRGHVTLSDGGPEAGAQRSVVPSPVPLPATASPPPPPPPV